MEAAPPAGPGAPQPQAQPQAQGSAHPVAGLLPRLRGKLFTW